MVTRLRFSRWIEIGLMVAMVSSLAAAPQQAAEPAANAAQSAAEDSIDRSEAYFHFSMAHLYRQLAMQFVRQEYVDKAIEEYKLAAEADPAAGYIREELIELYASTNRLDEAVAEANQAIEAQPENSELRKLLARIYTTYARDQENSSADQMLASAVRSYEKALELNPDDFEALVEISGLYRASGRDEQALEVLERSLEIKPNAPEALGRIAALYRETGRPDKSIEALERALENQDGNGALLQELAQSYQQAGQHKEAAEALQALLERQEQSGRNTLPIRRQLAESLIQANELEQARDQYEALLEAEPQNAEYHLRLSQIHRERRRFNDSWESLRKAQKLAPDSIEIKYNTVMLLEAERRFDEAVEALEAILTETEQSSYEGRERATRTMFLEHIGALHRDREDFESAIETYGRIAELNPEAASRVRALVIEAHRSARDFEAAMEASAAAVKEFPDDQSLAVQRAMLLADAGETKQAVEIFDGLRGGDMSELEIELSLAQVYEKGDRYDDAVNAVAKAEKLAEGDRQRIGVLFTYGSVLERAKRLEESEAKFRQLLEEDPDNASALNYLGYMLADQNRKLDEAHNMIQRALDLEPDNGAYLDSLGWVYYRQNKLELAERYLKRSLEQYGQDPVVHTHLGDVYYAMDRKEEASKHWSRGLEQWNKSPVAERDEAEISKLKAKLEKLGVKVSRAEDEKKSSKK